MAKSNSRLKISPYVAKQIPSSLRETSLKDILKKYYEWAERELPYGAIDYIKITNAGSGYTTAPTVTITGTNEQGFPILITDANYATAQAVLNDTGGVAYIKVIASGFDYNTATVTITGDGTGATAEARINTAYGTFQERIAKILQLRDVDHTDDKLLAETFKREFFQNIQIGGPNATEARRLLVKLIKHFYGAKGAVKAFKFLFRVLFNEDVQISYPYPKDANYLTVGAVYNDKPFLRLSETGYVQSISLSAQGTYTSAPTVNITGDGTGALAVAIYDPVNSNIQRIDMVNPGHGYTTASVSFTGGGETVPAVASATVRTAASTFHEVSTLQSAVIRGSISGASAIVENYYLTEQNGVDILHLNLTNLVGIFRSGEEVYYGADAYVDSDIAKRAAIYSVASAWTVVNGGAGYSPNDVLPVAAHNGGFGLSAYVAQTDSTTGAILSIFINDPGYDYNPANPPVLTLVSPANITISPSGMGYLQKRVPENAATGTDLLVRTKEYTYQITSSNTIDLWKDTVKKVVHPAGMNFISVIQFLSEGNDIGIDGGALNSTTAPGSLLRAGNIRNGLDLQLMIELEQDEGNDEYWYWYLDQLDVPDEVVAPGTENNDIPLEWFLKLDMPLIIVSTNEYGDIGAIVETIVAINGWTNNSSVLVPWTNNSAAVVIWY